MEEAARRQRHDDGLARLFCLLQVIGDKKGGKTSEFLSGKQWQNLSKELLDEVNLPVRLIHIVRNPYDNIATRTFKSLDMSTEEVKASKTKVYTITVICNLYSRQKSLDPTNLFVI